MRLRASEHLTSRRHAIRGESRSGWLGGWGGLKDNGYDELDQYWKVILIESLDAGYKLTKKVKKT